MSIQAFQEVLDSYKFWRTERHIIRQETKEKMSLLSPFSEKGEGFFTTVSCDQQIYESTFCNEQARFPHYLPEHQQIFWQLNTNIKDLRMPDKRSGRQPADK